MRNLLNLALLKKTGRTSLLIIVNALSEYGDSILAQFWSRY